MKKHLYLLFTESDIGIHKKEAASNEQIELSVLTFPLHVIKKDKEYSFSVNLFNNTTYSSALNRYFHAIKDALYADVQILIGYDIDESGEGMSEAIRSNLIEDGVPSEKILRMPLTEKGYVVLKNFSETGSYKRYLYLQQELMLKLRRMKVKKNVGFSKIMSLKHAVRSRGKTPSLKHHGVVDPNGTSTATVVTKFITGEE